MIGDPDTGSVPNAQVLNLISDVAVRPGTSEVVAFRGWRAGSAKNGLYVSRDVELVDGRLVVATDVGVYTAGSAGGTWKRVGGLPNVITTDVSATPDGRVLAATRGRGLWVIPKDALTRRQPQELPPSHVGPP